MSLVTVIWSMVASACLTMAGMHWLVWYKQRTEWANLLFAVTAMSTAIFAGTELWMMRAETPADLAMAIRWAHVPIWLVLVALVGFVRLYLRAGRAWLAWSFVGLRTLSLLLDFLTGQNLNYQEISAVRRIPFLGEPVSVAIGAPNPWMLVSQLGSLALILFVADAGVTVWRRGDRRKALLVGGSIVFFVLGGQVQTILVFWGSVQAPVIVSLFYLGIVTAMGYELSHDVLRAALLGRELRESEERMELAAGAAELGVWTWDIARDEIWATDDARALFGFTQSEPIDLDRFLRALHSDDREPLTQTLAKSMKGDGEYESEHQVVLPDGQIRWIASRGRVEFDGDGKPIRLRGVSVDISKRKQVEETRNNLAAIVESSDDAISSETLEGMITSWNAGAEKIYGYSASEMIGQHVSTLAPDDLKEEVTGIREQIRRGENLDHLETERVTRDGRRIYVSLTISPIKDEHGLSIGASTIARDITERKAAEHALRNALTDVERLKEQVERENIYLKEEIELEHGFREIIGESKEIKYVFFKINQVAPTDSTVLILGETGTGKELVARAIHGASRRSDRPLVKINCAALPANLIESELFGHEKGAFTGAHAKKVGRFEVADGATLFLDEIGELPLELQSKLLRVLQEGEFERLGSSRSIKVDVRIIAATNRNLKAEVQKGLFREDLWYRLDVFPITIQPLRQRKEDIPLLVNFFVDKFNRQLGKFVKTISPATLEALQKYDWPGNVRELANVVERAIISSQSNVLRLAERVDGVAQRNGHSVALKSLEDVERHHILTVLEECNWRIQGPRGAANILKLNSSTLRTRISKLGISKPTIRSKDSHEADLT